jgi:hypothetical protein
MDQTVLFRTFQAEALAQPYTDQHIEEAIAELRELRKRRIPGSLIAQKTPAAPAGRRLVQQRQKGLLRQVFRSLNRYG